jgi:hypothetical protein
MIPSKNATREEKLKAQADRAKKYGIKAQDGARLIPPPSFPQDEAKYGDPVNFAYPLDPLPRLRNALARFAQFAASAYKNDSAGLKEVADRIATAAMKAGIIPGADSAIMNYVSQAVKSKIEQARKVETKKASKLQKVFEAITDGLWMAADDLITQ